MNTPDILYHYTTQAGLLGIVESRTIWASAIVHLNDSSEWTRALGIGVQEVEDARKNHTHPKALEELGILSRMEGIIGHPFFVLSLSERSDQLSQWRGYGGTHSGFALGFSTQKLGSIASNHSFSLGRCLYDETTQRARMRQLIDSEINERLRGATTPTGFYIDLMRLAPLLKDPGFAEECEWRFVSLPMFDNVFFRTGPSTIVPYFRLPINLPSGECCLCEIVIGPTPHPTLARRAVRTLLDARGLSSPSASVIVLAYGQQKVPERRTYIGVSAFRAEIARPT